MKDSTLPNLIVPAKVDENRQAGDPHLKEAQNYGDCCGPFLAQLQRYLRNFVIVSDHLFTWPKQQTATSFSSGILACGAGVHFFDRIAFTVFGTTAENDYEI